MALSNRSSNPRLALAAALTALALAPPGGRAADIAVAVPAAAAVPAKAPPSSTAHHAAVAAPDEFGARAAMDVMHRGGNAVDAAVATAFVLAVTYPEAGNLGGGGFMMVYLDGKPACLDYREMAPAAATRDMYLDDNGQVIKDASVIGPRAAGVPGTVAGLWLAHQRYGKRPWRELLQPAIKLASEGFVPSPEMAKRIAEARGTTSTSRISIATSARCARARCSASRSWPPRSGGSRPTDQGASTKARRLS